MFCSQLNHFHRESYYGSLAQVLFSLILVKNGNIWSKVDITNYIQSYLHQFFDDFYGLKASLKPLRRPFDQY